jgi:hypothetical protein
VIAWADAFTDVHSWTEPLQLGLPLQAGTLCGALTWSWGGFLVGFSAGNDEATEARRFFHFPLDRGSTRVKRNSVASRKIVSAGIKDKDLMLTGIGLHTYQDSWAHEGFGPGIGHLFQGHEPDWPWKNIDKSMEMAEATYDRLAEYMKANHDSNPLKSWDDVKATVKSLLEEYDSKDEGNTKYRSDLWYAQTRKDFPDYNGSFSSKGDNDGWASSFLDAALIVMPDLRRARPIGGGMRR